MLTLSRKSGEVVTLTVPPSTGVTTIEVVVTKLHHAARVQLGFRAPREVEIVRDDAGSKREQVEVREN